MSFTQNFAASQTIGLPNIVLLTDTSTGSDGAITQRRAYLQQSDATYLVPSGTTTDYVVWPYADSSISINCLTQDTALNITIQWLDVSNAVLYSKTTLYDFTLYGEQFLLNLTLAQIGSTPNLLQSTGYYTNKMILRVNLDDADNAVSLGSNIYGAQQSLNLATYMETNQQLFF